MKPPPQKPPPQRRSALRRSAQRHPSQRAGLIHNWTPLALTYLVLALAGLGLTFTFNSFSVIEMRDFIGDWMNSGPAVSSLTVDLLVTAVAGSILIVVEGRRLGMRRPWVYLVFAGVTAFAFVFPLFFAMRERFLAEKRAAGDVVESDGR